MKVSAPEFAALFAAVLVLLVCVPQAAVAAGASSSTVTLSGYCSQPLPNTVDFDLRNSGNGTASSLSIAPYSEGVSFQGQNQSLAYIGPGGNVTFTFNVSSYPYPGSYAIGFLARYYQQGLQVSASFPCIIFSGRQPYSLVQLGQFNYSHGSIHALFYNLGPYAVNATIFTITPPNIYVRGSPMQVTIPASGRGEYNATFNVTVHQPSGVTSASYSAAVALQYVSNGMSHALFGNLAISAGGQQASSGQSLINYALYAAIASIVVLIAASVVVRRRGRASNNPVGAQ